MGGDRVGCLSLGLVERWLCQNTLAPSDEGFSDNNEEAGMQEPEVVCRSVTMEDFPDWSALFKGYLDFYHVQPEPDLVQRVWSWLHDDDHSMRGLVADAGDQGVVGLAHFTTWPLTLVGADAGYLSDLFVRNDLRGRGVGKKLITEVKASCDKQGLPVLFWLTQETNYSGRRLYDQFTPKSEFVAYMLEAKPDD